MSNKRSTSPLLPISAVALALVIFAVDTISPLKVSVSVLYVVVVLLTASFAERRGILWAAWACAAMTMSSYLITHGLEFVDEGFVRMLMSISAIIITSVLALRTLSATTTLREQARLLDLTHDSVFVRDKNDVITYWNRGADELYRFPRDLAIGRVSHDLLKTIFPAPLDDITAELLRTGRWEGELAQKKRDGSDVVVASRWSLERDARGAPVAVLELNNDVTERNRTQEALQQAQAELAHVTRVTTLGELTASIAHEVNQPLAAIVTSGEACLRWLGQGAPQLEEARAAIRRVIADGNRASQVIARVRALARKSDPKKVALNVNEVVEDALHLVQRELAGHQVAVRLVLGPVPAVLGDRVQLQQVIINLVVNGIQAMAGVTDRARELRIRTRHEAEQVLVAVEDSGTGIDPEQTKRLFEAFFTTKPGGMGMGLSICRSIIEAHGGRVWATSNTGAGATFQLTLPAA